MAASASETFPVQGQAPVAATEAMGYRFRGVEVVAFDCRARLFFLLDGARATDAEVRAHGLEPPATFHAPRFPSLGKYATCWLGDCVVTSLNGHRALVRTTCGTYAVAPRLLRLTRATCTVRGMRVIYGADGARCMVFASLTCTGGAGALLEEICGKMAAAGLRTEGDMSLLEMQSVDGPAVALRHIDVHGRMLLRLQGTVAGTLDSSKAAFVEVPTPVAMAHVVMEDYLHGNPWALPIGHDLLRERLGIEFLVDTTQLHGPYTSVDGCLYLEAPQRAISHPPFEVDAEQIVLGVRAGRLEPQRDGTYAMPYLHGGWGHVVPRDGTCLRKTMWQLDDLHDLCMPLGTHKVDVPGCPPYLMLERFGGASYDVEAKTVQSVL